MTYEITLTDTFGGEANFSWARKATFEAPDTANDSLLIRRGKKALGLIGRHQAASLGDTIELRWPSECIVAFIEAKEEIC